MSDGPDGDGFRDLLKAVAGGTTSVDDALATIRGFDVLASARVDVSRVGRLGFPEVIFGEGKTAAEIAAIGRRLYDFGPHVLATRVSPPLAAEVLRDWSDLPAHYDAKARCLSLEPDMITKRGRGVVTIVSAGTSDGPVAAEAAFTARLFGNEVRQISDVGVAGLHRLLAVLPELRASAVIIVVAGMEGALPSVLAGLVPRPVIAVPTSVGYGASFGGLAALLGMLNSCAAGVTVVNIDNGFGAAYAASLINRAEVSP